MFASRITLTALRAAPALRVSQASRPIRFFGAPIASSSHQLVSPRYYATGPESVSPTDPALSHAQSLLDEGTRSLEDGDLLRAKGLYEESVSVKPTSGGWFNLGVCEYQLGNKESAIEAWQKSIQLEPSADAYTNLGSAHMMARPPQPGEAIKALTAAMEISPNDPEIQFNLAAILESTDNLDTALALYRKAQSGGIERAAANIRNLGGKILAKRLREEEVNGSGVKSS